MTRKLCRAQFVGSTRPQGPCKYESIHVAGLSPIPLRITSSNGLSPNETRFCIAGPKNAFHLLDKANYEPSSRVNLDDLSIYNEMNVAVIKGKERVSCRMTCCKIWYNRKKQHPTLYGDALRVLENTVSPSACERVLSAIKIIVTDTCSRLPNENFEDMIVTQWLTE